MTGAKVFSVQALLTKGKNIIDLLDGTIENLDTSKTVTFKSLGYKSGKNVNIDKVRSILIFTDADLNAKFVGTDIDFDMMSFNKVIRNVEIERITLNIDASYVPDKNRVIIIASDDPEGVIDISQARPHLFYSNALVASNPGGSAINVDQDWQNLFFRHTVLDKTKVTVDNTDAAAKAIWVDIQHREVTEDDTNGRWTSYENFPMAVAIGDVLSFGDDALIDTKHHLHRVRVKTQIAGQTSPIKGEIFGV